jgi:hypothetical protein
LMWGVNRKTSTSHVRKTAPAISSQSISGGRPRTGLAGE